eukprot:6143777-Prymnesium_polylepis.1
MPHVSCNGQTESSCADCGLDEQCNGDCVQVGAQCVRQAPPSSPPPMPSAPPLCGSDCLHNDDGDCDDGGAGHEYSYCEYGSDCSDCGERSAHTAPRPPPRPPPSPPPPPPPCASESQPQCGGLYHFGPTRCCQAQHSCVYYNNYWHQCQRAPPRPPPSPSPPPPPS